MPTWLAKGRLAMNWLTAPKRAETLAMATHGGEGLQQAGAGAAGAGAAVADEIDGAFYFLRTEKV